MIEFAKASIFDCAESSTIPTKVPETSSPKVIMLVMESAIEASKPVTDLVIGLNFSPIAIDKVSIDTDNCATVSFVFSCSSPKFATNSFATFIVSLTKACFFS